MREIGLAVSGYNGGGYDETDAEKAWLGGRKWGVIFLLLLSKCLRTKGNLIWGCPLPSEPGSTSHSVGLGTRLASSG